MKMIEFLISLLNVFIKREIHFIENTTLDVKIKKFHEQKIRLFVSLLNLIGEFESDYSNISKMDYQEYRYYLEETKTKYADRPWIKGESGCLF